MRNVHFLIFHGLESTVGENANLREERERKREVSLRFTKVNVIHTRFFFLFDY